MGIKDFQQLCLELRILNLSGTKCLIYRAVVGCFHVFKLFLKQHQASNSSQSISLRIFFGVWDCKEKVQIFLISLWVDFSCVLAVFSNYGNTEGEPQTQWMNEWMNDNQSLCSESLLNFRYEVPGSRLQILWLSFQLPLKFLICNPKRIKKELSDTKGTKFSIGWCLASFLAKKHMFSVLCKHQASKQLRMSHKHGCVHRCTIQEQSSEP